MMLNRLIDPFQRANGAPPKSLLGFMGWSLSGSWRVVLIAGFFSALAGSFEVISSFILGRVVDLAAAGNPSTFLEEHAGTLVLFVLFFLVLRPITFGLSAASAGILVGPNLLTLTMARLNRWTLRQSVTFFDDDFAGRIAQKQMQTSRAITDVMMEVVNVVAFALASVIGSMLLLTAIDGRVAAVLLLWLCGYVGLLGWFLPRIRKRSKERAAARAMVTGQVVDTITNIKTVKLFAHDRHEDAAALKAMASLRLTSLEFGKLSAAFRWSLMTLAGVLPVALIGGTLLAWQAGTASAGEIAAAGSVSIRLAQMTGWVSFTLLAMYGNLGEIEDGMRTLTPSPTLVDAPNAQDLTVTQAEIRFDAVSYQYGREKGGVSDVSLLLPAGKRLGIVGPSGAGKSTLVSLLLRLYDAEQGLVLIDDQSVSSVTQESLRRQISMVTQDTGLFNRSALENIRYGSPEASDEDVRNAAKKAQALDFILGLEDHQGRQGFEAHLGERGVKLSGGQRQRIALARAILKDAPILVLDEATSALDSESEMLIQAALDEAMKGKTVITIAHRLSTLANMDEIIVLDDGAIVEQGTHEHLLNKNGLYARFWNRQAGGFLGINEAAE